jgi:hypothetical protein
MKASRFGVTPASCPESRDRWRRDPQVLRRAPPPDTYSLTERVSGACSANHGTAAASPARTQIGHVAGSPPRPARYPVRSGSVRKAVDPADAAQWLWWRVCRMADGSCFPDRDGGSRQWLSSMFVAQLW